MTTMLAVEEAQPRVLDEVRVLDDEVVLLANAHGRVLREDVAAPYDLPRGDNSAMDGYALIADDTPGELRVLEDIAAGHVPKVRIERGTASRIMTGALIPDGADAVAQVEITDGGREVVRVNEAVARGTNVRRRGDDMRAGDIILRSGALIRAEAGAWPQIRGSVRDDRDATIAAIESALDCDFILSSGGVSVGAFDFVKDALDALGGETKFWRVAVKPGKPVVLSRVRERLYFGLPGNPVSSMVGFLLFVRPALRKAMGESAHFDPIVSIRTTAPLRSKGDRRTYLRVRVIARDGELVAEPMRAQGSHISTSMLGANGLAILEAGTTLVNEHERVIVLLFGPMEHRMEHRL